MATLVFLTLYLGLVSGRQSVALQADAAVKSIRVTIDGATAATLTAPPWRGEVDFGPQLLPHEIVAVGFGENGKEIARVSQFVNVPRADAEVELALARGADGTPQRATLVGRHLAQAEPRDATLKLDEAPVAVGKDFSAALPAVDMKRPHLLAAEVRFADGAVARREVVFGGQFAESAEAQLTPIAVVRTGSSDALPSDGCFVANGVPLRVRSIEQGTAEVIVVREPTISIANKIGNERVVGHGFTLLADGTYVRLLSPVPERAAKEQKSTTLFPLSRPYEAWRDGVFHLLGLRSAPSRIPMPRMWADAVAVAGVHAAAEGRRRVVILVPGGADKSDYQAATVRDYLDALDVPLVVWSAYRSNSAGWGTVADVSSLDKLSSNVDLLRTALDVQRVAWIEADPLTALRAEIKNGCGYKRAAP